MAEQTTVRIAENSPEEVAYRLFEHIVSVENRGLSHKPQYGEKPADREWILNTYAEALLAVRNPTGRNS